MMILSDDLEKAFQECKAQFNGGTLVITVYLGDISGSIKEAGGMVVGYKHFLSNY